MSNKPRGKPFVKGDPRRGHRPKGLENQKTRDIKEVVGQVINFLGDPVRMQERLERIDSEQPGLLIRFLSAVCPKDIKIGNADNKPFVIIRLPAKEVEKP
jgi:hypothetical protein